jgi:hypothetical protein
MLKSTLAYLRMMRRRRILPGGIIEERTAMGRVLTIPATPRGRIDISAGAPGWEALHNYQQRQRGQY